MSNEVISAVEMAQIAVIFEETDGQLDGVEDSEMHLGCISALPRHQQQQFLQLLASLTEPK